MTKRELKDALAEARDEVAELTDLMELAERRLVRDAAHIESLMKYINNLGGTCATSQAELQSRKDAERRGTP